MRTLKESCQCFVHSDSQYVVDAFNSDWVTSWQNNGWRTASKSPVKNVDLWKALLFEMGWDKYCDFIIVADVDYEIQKQRVMKRDKVSADDFDKINNVQMDNKKKIELADIVINTNKPKNLLRSELIKIIERLEAADGQRNCF